MDKRPFILKNTYISPDEFDELITKLKRKENRIHMYKLIYLEGKRIGVAKKEAGVKESLRAVQKQLARISKNTISLRDLRKAYFLNNPDKLYDKINKNNAKRKPINARLRWEVLKRDDFKCVSCGISSRFTELHVDHIYPKSYGGEDTMDNLQTLCVLCNLGKKNILSGDNI